MIWNQPINNLHSSYFDHIDHIDYIFERNDFSKKIIKICFLFSKKINKKVMHRGIYSSPSCDESVVYNYHTIFNQVNSHKINNFISLIQFLKKQLYHILFSTFLCKY